MIVQTKKIRVITSKEFESMLIPTIHKNGKMMLASQKEAADILDKQQNLNKIEKYITLLEHYQKRKFFEYHEIDSEAFESSYKNGIDIIEKIDLITSKTEDINERIKVSENELSLLVPYKDLQVLTKDLNQLKTMRVIYGYYDIGHETNIISKMSFYDHNIETISQIDNRKYVIIVCMRNDYDTVIDILINAQFISEKLPDLTMSVAHKIEIENENLKSLKKQLTEANSEMKALSSHVNELKYYYDYLLNKTLEANVELSKTDQTVYIEGWIAEDTIKRFNDELNESFDCYIEVIEDNKDEIKPTLTRNNKFVKQFETITNMYSVPNEKEIDPNPVMSIWYWFIFGIMMGDIGYGLAMVIFFLMFIKYKKPKGELKKLAWVFAYSGISSIIFGIIFGSFFGTRLDLLKIIGTWFGNPEMSSILLEPVNDPLPMLIVSLAIGVLHIITGLVMKTILEVRRKNIASALSDGLSWILILIGIVISILVKPMLLGVISITLGIILILSLRGYREKGLFKKAMSGLGGLYGVTNYLSDILSYSRILALSLSTAVIAFTMNMLADMVSGSFIGFIFAIVIYLIGHIFNFVMGLLSAYVHDGRLQYLEYFGKFYEGGGIDFVPFKYQLKYIDEIIKENK